MENKVDYQLELDQIRAKFEFDLMALALVEPAEFQYVIKWKYASGNLNDRYKRIVLQSGKGIAGIVFKTGKSVFIPSIDEYVGADSLFNYPIVQSEKLKSVGAVPLWKDARVAGVLLGGFRSESQITEQLLEELERLAGQGIGDLDGKEMMSN